MKRARATNAVSYTHLYRISKSVRVPTVKAKLESLLSSIKAFGLGKECIIYEEKPNKEALAELKDCLLYTSHKHKAVG